MAKKIEIIYSFDDKEYHMMRNAWMEANHPVKIDMFAACPDGNGFKATFSDFKVTHLPEKVRTDWLNANRPGESNVETIHKNV